MLEAGPSDWHPFIHIPAGFMYTLVTIARVNWLYSMEPSEWTGGRRIAAPRGKTLGGSSSINGHIYNRGQRMDFDTWAQRGNRGWGYADVLPYFRRSERRLGDGDDRPSAARDGQSADHRPRLARPALRGLHRGRAARSASRATADYNGAHPGGRAYVQRTIENGRRVSAAPAFLHPAHASVPT